MTTGTDEQGGASKTREAPTGAGPNLRLPPRPGPGGSRGGPRLGFVYVLLLIAIGLEGWSLLRAGGPSTHVNAAEAPGDVDAERAIAMKLEERNLPDAAADAWERYLANAGLDSKAEAAVRYRRGKLLEQAEHYQEAISAFYRAEQLLGPSASGELPRQITLHVRECLRKLGQYSDLTREMAERADVSGGDTSLSSRQVVAQIGDEKITVADFDRMLTAQIEQMVSMQVGISEEDADALRRRAHARFEDPQAKAEQLQQMVASRVLAAESRKRGLQESERFRRQLAAYADELLARELMLDEVGRRATVTPQDVERYYAANKERYAEPATASIAHILCSTEAQAREVLAEAVGDADFGALAKEHSLDAKTADSGGVIAQPVSQDGDYVPGIGRHAELHAAIMAAPADTVLVNPYQSDAGWHVVKVVGRTERVQRTLDEVRDQVERDARAARRAEVTRQYLQELFDARGVKFYPGAFTDAGGTEASKDAQPDED